MEGAHLDSMGLACSNLGETRTAIEYYNQSRSIACEMGDLMGEGNALGNLGNAYFALGDARRAIEYYEQALVIARRINDKISKVLRDTFLRQERI